MPDVLRYVLIFALGYAFARLYATYRAERKLGRRLKTVRGLR